MVEQWRIKNGIAHGPYHFRVWWEGGRQRKRYVRPADLADVRAACSAWRERRTASGKERARIDARDDARDGLAAEKAIELAQYPEWLARSLLKIDAAFGGPEMARDVERAYARLTVEGRTGTIGGEGRR